MAPSRTSIYNVAEIAGVSAGTVSRILNGRAGFSKATRDQVLGAARQLKFRPRITTRKRTIAIVTDKARYATFGGFLSCLHLHLTEEMARTNIAIQLFTEANLGQIDPHTIDGILSISWDAATYRQLRQLEQDTSIPVLVLNHCDIDEFSSVESDYEGAGFMVADHLRKHGHSRIGYIIEDRTPGAMRRLEGMKNRLAEENIEFDESLIALTRHSRMEDAVAQIMRYEPTALFIGSEDLVLEALSTVRDTLGLKVPDDISLVAMENIHVNRFTTPAITSVRQPLELMAAQAMEILNELADQSKGKTIHRILKNEWIERLSLSRVPDEILEPAGV